MLGDHYIGFTPLQVLLPFTTHSYRPLWVGLGQLSFYIMALVSLSVYIRQQIGKQVWRLIHFSSFLTFVLALAHGLVSGTDSATFWAQGIYGFCGLSILGLLVYRITVAVAKKRMTTQEIT
jgi:predicted ferric reductase